MNILFLTMLKVSSIEDRGIYTDLMREFVKRKHNLFVVYPIERREKIKTNKIKKDNLTIHGVPTLNLQKTSLFEKGIGQLLLEYQFLRTIKKELSSVTFDIIIYSTPPITFYKVINYIKKRDNAFAYLLLKDIFPQNAVDLKMIRENGILHQFFRRKEEKLYGISDKIGCMSPANMQYILKHNIYLNSEKVEVNPNTIFPIEVRYSNNEKDAAREKYTIPVDKKVFVYGGNLGKPQGVNFLLEIIAKCKNTYAYFLIIGSGTEYLRIKYWFDEKKPTNAKLIKGLPKDEYDKLLAACDVGMIFLHKDFTIPNFPSRLLSYLEMKMPVFAATDVVTDIGDIIEENKCGYSVVSGNIVQALQKIDLICEKEDDFKIMQENSFSLLCREYRVDRTCQLIFDNILENV